MSTHNIGFYELTKISISFMYHQIHILSVLLLINLSCVFPSIFKELVLKEWFWRRSLSIVNDDDGRRTDAGP